VSGYKGNGEAMLAMERNEVHGIVGTELSSLRATRPDWIRDNKVRIVMQIGLTKSPDLPDVPSGLDLIKSKEGRAIFELLLARQEYGRPFALPPGTSPDVVAAFRQAFAAMAKDEAFLKDAAKMRADIIVGSGAEVSALFAKTYASPKPVVERAIATFKGASGKR
jgi:tripartite-type tricarboxylate transporter receptor subunit TctC